jgi:hypothetical protein
MTGVLIAGIQKLSDALKIKGIPATLQIAAEQQGLSIREQGADNLQHLLARISDLKAVRPKACPNT